MYLPVDDIHVENRLRDGYDEGKFKELKESIAWVGQLQAIVVTRNDVSHDLKYGANRLRAIRELHAEGREIPNLPKGLIRVEEWGELSEETGWIIEYEENERRAEFTWQERAKYVRRFHERFKQKSPSWTAEMTAASLKISTGMISYLLNLDKAVEEHPEVAKAETLSAAVKRMKTIEKLAFKKHGIEQKPAYTKAQQVLLLGDSCDWIVSVPDESVDLVNFDPPWGDEASRKSAENWAEFNDSTEYSNKLMHALFPEIYRILKPDSFCLFWYRTWAQHEMRELALSYKFNTTFTRTPCIWYKPDKTSDQNRFPEKQPIDCYENFYILRKGDPVFNERNFQNVFVAARVQRAAQIHQTEKPVELMERLVKICTVPGATVVDPCAGSGSTLIAAYQASRRPLGCELDKKNYERALVALAEAMKGAAA